MEKARIAVILLVGILVVSSFACCGGSTTKNPDDIIPLTIPGFNFVGKSNWVDGVDNVEYSVYSYFTPKANTEFEGIVQNLSVAVFLFKDDASAGDLFLDATGERDSSTEIQVNGMDTILNYGEDISTITAIQKRGRLVIVSHAIPSFEATPIDEQVLKDAAIEGLRAINW